MSNVMEILEAHPIGYSKELPYSKAIISNGKVTHAKMAGVLKGATVSDLMKRSGWGYCNSVHYAYLQAKKRYSHDVDFHMACLIDPQKLIDEFEVTLAETAKDELEKYKSEKRKQITQKFAGVLA